MKRKIIVLFLSTLLILTACGSTGLDVGEQEEDATNEVQTSNNEEEKNDESATEEGPIYFAFYGPLTGSGQQYGLSMKAAVEIAQNDINEDGGILGRQLVIDYFDDQNDANEAVNIANKIVTEDKYSGVIGSFSTSCTMSASPIFEQAKIVNYTPSSSHSELSKSGNFVFQNYLTQAYESEKYAEYLYNDMGIKSVGIVYVNNDYGNNVVEHFTKHFEELGGTITAAESFVPEQTLDFSPMITKVKESNPEAFYPVAFYEDTANILKQADGLDFKAENLILTSSVMTQAVIDLSGELVEGAVILSAYPATPNNEKFERVLNEYSEKTGKAGDLYVMLAYDVTDQIATAIQETGSTDPDKVRDTLNNMKDYDALAGSYDMSEDGRALRQVFPVTVEDGQFVDIE